MFCCFCFDSFRVYFDSKILYFEEEWDSLSQIYKGSIEVAVDITVDEDQDFLDIDPILHFVSGFFSLNAYFFYFHQFIEECFCQLLSILHTLVWSFQH